MLRHSLIALLAVLSVSQSSIAADEIPSAAERAKLPASLTCTADDHLAYPSGKDSFEITFWKSAAPAPEWDPESNIDGSFMGMNMNVTAVSFGFSNQCDNSYDFLFLNDDLQALASGKLTEVRGLLHFANYNGDDESKDGALDGTTILTCKKN